MDADKLPAQMIVQDFERLAEDITNAYETGDAETIRRIERHFGVEHPLTWEEVGKRVDERLGNLLKPPSDRQDRKLASADTQFLIARQYGFENWPTFTAHVEALADPSSNVSQFEAAIEAIITGDADTIERLLREKPELIQSRSTRVHGATLLHYVGANGVEDYRQKTPKNIVGIAELLLRTGSEVDAVAPVYGGTTTLGLVATSVHPWLAGVQEPLMKILLDHGADLEGAVAPDYIRGNVVNACLANGRGAAASFLAQRGAALNLEGAAGVGRLDVVQSFFTEDGSLKATATRAEMEAGFQWACEYGHNRVVEFLVDRGVDLRAGEKTDLTGLHWAAAGGQIRTIKLLLERGAPLEALNVYGGTVLGQALWSAYNGDPDIDYAATIETLIEAGARIDVYPEMKGFVDAVLQGKHR
ncbi:MAG: ankyrin repeat domain-containing protein [Acidobacteriota bacterium]